MSEPWKGPETPEWLEQDEQDVATWTAAVPLWHGRGAKYGGRLHLTSQRLVWVPLRITTVGTAGGVVVPIDAGGSWWELPLTDVAAVEADLEHRGLLHIVARDGNRTSFLVAVGRLGPIWSRRNQFVRDDAVARIGAASRQEG